MWNRLRRRTLGPTSQPVTAGRALLVVFTVAALIGGIAVVVLALTA
jgi:hypothetical protein